MPPIDKLLSQYSAPVRSWPGEEWMDEEARANYEAANPPKLQTEGGAIDKGDLLPIVRYPEAKKSPSEWQSSSDVMRQLDDGWRIEPFSRLTAPFKSMAQAWREQPLLGPMVRPSQMHPEVFNQMSGDAMTVAGTGMTGGIGRAAVGSPVPHGVTELGIFGGRKAKTADLDALARAEEMVRIGRPREEVWSETGWFQGPDKQWRFEIDDSGNMMTGEGANYHPGRLRSEILDQAESREAGHKSLAANGYQGRLDQILDHKDAFAAYPDLAGTTWASVPGEKMAIPNVGGVWKGDRFGMEINADYSPRLQTGKSITLHELQHGIQDAENFARGSNVRMFELDPEQIAAGQRQLAEMGDAEIIRETAERYSLTPREAAAKLEQDFGRAPDPEAIAIAETYPLGRIQERAARIRQRLSDATDPKSAYNRTAGEAEARLVQKRIDMTADERRARPPWLDYDIPEDQIIVRSGGESGAMSNKPGIIRDELPAKQPVRIYAGHEDGSDRSAQWWFTTDPKHAREFGEVTEHDVVAKNPITIDARSPVWQRLFGMGGRDADANLTKTAEKLFAAGHDMVAVKNWEGSGLVVLMDGEVDRFAAPPSSPTLMASIDPLTTAITPPRAIDPLGYYSPTLDAALRLSQKKGTPEQMLAQLKKAGAKDSEMEVAGIATFRDEEVPGQPGKVRRVAIPSKWMAGKKSVSQEEIVKALEEGKIGLNEKRYTNEHAEMMEERALAAKYREKGMSPDQAAMMASRVMDKRSGRAGDPKYADYSLDPENPTYREVVLHLPKAKARPSANGYWEVTAGRGRPEVFIDEASARARAAEVGGEARPQMIESVGDNFQSGHFGEPNIVGHMMVSETLYNPDRVALQARWNALSTEEKFKPENKHIFDALRSAEQAKPARVLTLDQVQSDWGQKLRDGGVRDEGKIAELRSKIADLEAKATEEAKGWTVETVDDNRFTGQRTIKIRDESGRMKSQRSGFRGTDAEALAEAQRSAIAGDLRLLNAELSTVMAATPGHPLVNTTDQWLNTTLRRAIRMASEEGQDYIAIPSGKTMYTAQEAGMGSSVGDKARSGIVSFYGGMPEEMSDVMSSLKQAATKAPNEPVINVLDPKTIDALASAGILDKKKIENISAARVLKNAEARFQGIVPKNLYALLQKLDKNTPPPQVIDTLDSPSGKTGLGEGFTLFKITPEAKKAAREGGQPLFRFGGRVI